MDKRQAQDSPSAPNRLVEKTFVAGVEHHGTLASTNDRARQCAAKGLGPLPLLIVADEQTAGRGRDANRWWTGRGGLACSLLLDAQRLGIDRARSPLVALAAAVAIVRTAAPLLPLETVGVHWPNDVYARGRKLAGVLVEAVSSRLHVVGIGVNINNSLEEAPPELQKRATTMRDLTGTRHDQATFLLALLEHLAKLLAQLASTPDQVAARADALCLQHGQTLTIESGGQVTAGRCVGIGSDGALLLDTPDGRQTFYSAVLR